MPISTSSKTRTYVEARGVGSTNHGSIAEFTTSLGVWGGDSGQISCPVHLDVGPTCRRLQLQPDLLGFDVIIVGLVCSF